MVERRTEGYVWRMATTTAISSPSIRPLTLVAALVLAVFGAFTMWVVVTHGFVEFIELAGREAWVLQMLLDLVIALLFALGWMIGDARKRGIATWPYVAATVTLGSIGVLAYCVRRSFTPPRGT
jgi:hypothetical protein